MTIGKKEKQEQAEAAVAPGVPARAPSVKLKGPSAPKVHMSGPELPKFEAPQVKGHCMKCSCCPWLAEVVPGCDSSQDCCGFSCWKCEFGFPCSSCCTGACNVAKIKIISGTSVPCILNVCFCNCCFRCKRATACCATLSEIALKAGFAAKEAVVGDDSL